jgi:DNA-binding transcriptional regulator YiaG
LKKKKKRKYYSEACEAIHEGAKDLYEIGAITGERMREYDEMCFIPEDEAPVAETTQSQPVTSTLAHLH